MSKRLTMSAVIEQSYIDDEWQTVNVHHISGWGLMDDSDREKDEQQMINQWTQELGSNTNRIKVLWRDF